MKLQKSLPKFLAATLLAGMLLALLPGCDSGTPATTTTRPPVVTTTQPPTTPPATTPPATTPPATTPPATTPPATTPPATTTPPAVSAIEHVMLTGPISAISAGTYTIGGQTFTTNAATQLDNGLVVGAVVRVEFVVQGGAQLAKEIRVRNDPATPLMLEGILGSVSAGTYSIGGQSFTTNATTSIAAGLQAGDPVRVHFTVQTGGAKLASRIESRIGENFKITGTISSISAGTYVVGGLTFTTNAATLIDTGLAVGVTATVQYTFQANRTRLATSIETDAQGAAGQDFKFTGALQAKGAGSWTIGGKTFLVNAATILDQGLNVGVNATVEFIVQADGSFLAKQIETPAPDDQADNNFHFAGTIQSVSAGTYVIGGQTFLTNAATILDTGLVVGAPARVEFIIQANGTKLATDIQTP